ncbi:MAG: MFS transporter [Candidatus Nanopelagicales bacterium]|nr:MFS transporter [Candidatus Nanopelagicales bacterium]MCU0295275.1 MFS transporter [Candidatus Nanopelagicales bacterium]
MFAPYGRVLRTPGAPAFTTAGFIGRLPISMISLGIVLLETSKGVSYGVAGSIAAGFAVAAAIGGPIVSGFVDRHGQHRVLPWATGLYAVSMVALLVALDASSPLYVVIPLAAGAGFMMPNLGSLVRARWAYVLPGSDGIHVAYAWESILDEVVFVLGPPLATVLALQVDPRAALVTCVVLVVIGTGWLFPQRRTEPPPHGRAKRTGRLAVMQPGMPFLFLAFVFVGGIFGSFEVVTVAFAQEQDATSATGVLLAIYAFGSLLAGFVYGSLRSPRFHGRRMTHMLTAMAVVTLGFPIAPNVTALAVVAFLAGLSVSPVLISGTALVERIIPNAQLTEGITWTSTGMALGLALATPASGAIIDAQGAHVAYLVTAGCAILACATSWAGSSVVHRAEVRALEIIAAQSPVA